MNAVLISTDLQPTADDIADEVLAGLARSPKSLPSKYFYDARGSELFEEITRQPEYYLTRVELALLQASAREISDAVGPYAHVVEYGSGSGRKTRVLLGALEDPVAYTPIEISESALVASVERLEGEFDDLEVLPVCADFTQPLQLPQPERETKQTLVFFPGSTLGNFSEDDSVGLLRAMRQTMGARGGALIGIDMQKSTALLEAAYNDKAGITAAFTLNLLTRLNREIASDFSIKDFEHQAGYSTECGSILTYLVSKRAQTVTIKNQRFEFSEGEKMQVEYSRKYTDAGFAALAEKAGLKVVRAWKDPQDWFGIKLLKTV